MYSADLVSTLGLQTQHLRIVENIFVRGIKTIACKLSLGVRAAFVLGFSSVSSLLLESDLAGFTVVKGPKRNEAFRSYLQSRVSD